MVVGDRLTEHGRQVFGNLPHGPGPRPGQMISALRLRTEFLEQSHACYVGDVTRIDKVRAPLASRARPGAGGDLTSRTLEDVDECRGPQDGRRHRLPSQVSLDLHMPGKRIEARCRPQGGEFDNLADASSDGAVDQRDLVGHLLWRRAMRKEQPIGPMKRVLKRMRLIEINSGDAGPVGQLSCVGPPGQDDDIDWIGSEEAGQRRADAPRRTRYGNAGLARCRLDFPGHVEVTLVSWNDQSKIYGTIVPRCQVRCL